MAEIRRNGPCPCGSGCKAKRCCFSIQETGVHHLPPELCKEVVLDLMGIEKVALRSLIDQVRHLPEMEATLRTRPEKGVPEVDSIDRRCELAQAVLTLREQGCIPPKVAAAAVLELIGEETTLFSPQWPDRLRSWLAAVAVLPG